MEPRFLAIQLRKLLLWLTLECFRRKFVRKQIDWTGRAGSLSQKRLKSAGFCPKVGVASKISCTLRAQECTTTPLFAILDPPLLSYTTNFHQNIMTAITLSQLRPFASVTMTNQTTVLYIHACYTLLNGTVQ